MTLDSQGRVWSLVRAGSRSCTIPRAPEGGQSDALCGNAPRWHGPVFRRYRPVFLRRRLVSRTAIVRKGQADGPARALVPMRFHDTAAMPCAGGRTVVVPDRRQRQRDRSTARHLRTRPFATPRRWVLRLTPDCQRCEVIAQGFAIPTISTYAAGDLFTTTATPTRLLHCPGIRRRASITCPRRASRLALTGYMRAWCRAITTWIPWTSSGPSAAARPPASLLSP